MNTRITKRNLSGKTLIAVVSKWTRWCVFTPVSRNSSRAAVRLGDFKSLGGALDGGAHSMQEMCTGKLNYQCLSSRFIFCARPEGQPASSSALLCGPHSAQSSWRLEAWCVGRPVIDRHSLPNYLTVPALCSSSPLR